nr:hypothetical protein [uncultured Gellertiella sp.]
MTHLIARIGLAALIAAGSLSALAPMARADDFGVQFQFGGGGDDGAFIGRRHRHHHWDNDGWGGEQRRGCRPDEAVDAARYEGLRHARIARITPRVVVVQGRGPYGWQRMVFANVPGCPVLEN